MSKYRRIEINAFRRRVTVVSGERLREMPGSQPVEIEEDVSRNDTDLAEPVALDSADGQLILVEAVRSLERRLSPEARATIQGERKTLTTTHSTLNAFYRRLRSFYELWPKPLRFARKGD